MKTVGIAALLVLWAMSGLAAEPAAAPSDPRLAQLSLPTGPGADWRQWDSFLVGAVKKLAQDLGESRREQLRDVFLDSRYQLVQAVAAGTSDPVPALFIDTWSRLSPVVTQAVSGLAPETAARYRSFVATMDGAASLTGLGHRLGLVRVTPDMLRGASALLGTGDAVPMGWTWTRSCARSSGSRPCCRRRACRRRSATGPAPAQPLGGGSSRPRSPWRTSSID